jgi:PKD repeat protein
LKSGDFTVQATWIHKDDKTEHTTKTLVPIHVVEKRYISYDPKIPSPDESVRFAGFNFYCSILKWDYGDGTIDYTGTTAWHIYKNEGTYTVNAVDCQGTSSVTISKQITIAKKYITYQPSQPRALESVNFTAHYFSSSTIRWNFGDGSAIQTGSSTISHIYNSAGSYEVLAYDGDKATQPSARVTLTVIPKPVPSITYTPSQPKEKENVTFTAINFTSTSFIRWNFGDGAVEDDNSPPTIIHAYNKAGTYYVQAYNGLESMPAATTTVAVTALPKPQPYITYSPPQPRTDENVTFTAVNFTSTNYIRWDFGDGSVEDDTSPPSVVHAYRNAGTYTVNAYDGGTAAVTASATVTVAARPHPYVSYIPSQPRRNENVTFTAYNFTSASLIRWDFGDGTVEDDTSPPTILHAYRNKGTFLVRAFDGGGGTVTAQVSVIVDSTPEPYISYSPPQPWVDEDVTFVAYNFTSTTLIRWDFGDGTVEDDTSPPAVVHAYHKEDTYVVKAFDGGGSNVTAQVTVRANARPEPYISYTPNQPRVGERVNFTAYNFLSKSLIRWDFGDGTVENDLNPPNIGHTYREEGTFTVRAFDGGGANITAETTVKVIQPIITYAPSQPFVDENVTFTARHFSSTTLIRWDFGDGTVLNDNSPPSIIHAYRTTGTFQVLAFDEGGSRVTARATVTVQRRYNPWIAYDPAEPRINEAVTFTAHDFASNLIRWDFGDGTVVDDPSPPDISHTYLQAGIYQVRAADAGGTAVTAEVTVEVYPNAYITFTPADPRPGEQVIFTANYFFSRSLIRWDFGDGTIEDDISPPSIAHAFRYPGTYSISAFDRGGGDITASAAINVRPERGISFSPSQPRVGEEITFQAINFSSQAVRWDFGDGTVLMGTATQKYGYRVAGTYNIIAYDFRGTEQISGARTSIIIFPAEGPRAPFSISFINLRFGDGKSYSVFDKGFAPVIAYADIKFEGTGNLTAQWLVDRQPFKTVTLPLTYAGEMTLDSGDIPGLPTLVPGIHEVALIIIQPQTEFAIPVLRYYVLLGVDEKEKIGVSFARASDLKDQEIQLSGDYLEIAPNTYFLLRGKVENKSQVSLPIALLRIYLEDELVDERLLKNLRSLEEREFVTSIFFPSKGTRMLYVALYDISKVPPEIIFVKTITLFSK